MRELAEHDRLNEAFEALSHPYRRQLLLALSVENPQADTDRDPLQLLDDDADPDVLETELVHTHLPKLESMGVIEWNRETGEIAKGPEWATVEPLIRLIHDHREELPDGFL